MSGAPRVLELICAKCGGYWDMENDNDMDARELADGCVCVGCPKCKADIAVVTNQ